MEVYFFGIESTVNTASSDTIWPVWMPFYLNFFFIDIKQIMMTLLASEANSPVTGEFPSQRSVTQSFDVVWDIISPTMTSL